MIATLRAIVFFGFLILGFLIFIPPWMVLDLFFRFGNKFETPARWLFPWLFPLVGIRVKLHNPEILETDRPFVILSNHQSYLDVPVIITYIRLTAFLAKKELFQIPIFGTSLRMAGVLEVDRQNPRANRDLGDRMMANLNKGYFYGAFPEGTRSRDGSLLDFKKGIFHYCVKANIPILPVTFVNAGEIMPPKKMKIHAGQLDVIIHPIISSEEVSNLNSNELKDKVYNIIKSGLK